MPDLPSIEERTTEAMHELIRCVNYMGSEKRIAEVIATNLQNSHRTTQQSFMRTFAIAMQQYSEAGTDLRNEGAVQFAKDIVALEPHLPYI